jgi:hypothetical protein
MTAEEEEEDSGGNDAAVESDSVVDALLSDDFYFCEAAQQDCEEVVDTEDINREEIGAFQRNLKKY